MKKFKPYLLALLAIFCWLIVAGVLGSFIGVTFGSIITTILLGLIIFIKNKKFPLTKGYVIFYCIIVFFCIVLAIPMEQEIELTASVDDDTVLLSKETVEVSGTVVHADYVTVNDKKVTLKDDAFSTEVPLKEGENTIVVLAAKDNEKNSDMNKTVKLTVTRENPDIALSFDKTSIISENKSTTISGYTEPKATVSISNDKEKLETTTADENMVRLNLLLIQ